MIVIIALVIAFCVTSAFGETIVYAFRRADQFCTEADKWVKEMR